MGGAFAGDSLDSLKLVVCNSEPRGRFVVTVAAGETVYLRFAGTPENRSAGSLC